METVLRTYGICKSYKNKSVLNDVYITINRGDIYGFVGKNGAGKTTLIRILSGLSVATSGKFELFGISSDSRDIVKARKHICSMVESPAIYPELTAEDNMRAQCLILKKPFSVIKENLEFVGLGDVGKKKAKNFSLGMRQRLAIAVALIGEPELMLLDEPINGLDPEGIKQVREMLLKLRNEKGITILISSHILSELSLLATRYGFIDNGRILKEATAEEVVEATSEKCYLDVNNIPKAIERLKKLGYEPTEHEGKIKIPTDIDVMKVCADFSKNGIYLNKHIHAAVDLEEYFMRLIGGRE